MFKIGGNVLRQGDMVTTRCYHPPSFKSNGKFVEEEFTYVGQANIADNGDDIYILSHPTKGLYKTSFHGNFFATVEPLTNTEIKRAKIYAEMGPIGFL